MQYINHKKNIVTLSTTVCIKNILKLMYVLQKIQKQLTFRHRPNQEHKNLFVPYIVVLKLKCLLTL